MTLLHRLTGGAALIGLMLLSLSGAHAALIANLQGVSGSGPYVYTYTAQLTGGALADPSLGPAYVTVPDFTGYMPGSAKMLQMAGASAADFTVTAQASNVTVAFNGANTILGPANSLFTFSLTSQHSDTLQHSESGTAISVGSQSNSSDSGLSVQTSTPDPVLTPAATPEPGVLGMVLASGISGSILLLRRRPR